MRVLCILFEGTCPTIHAFAESCYRLSPDICLRGSEAGSNAVFIEISRCLTLYREETAILRIQALLRRFALKARIGAADSLPLALAYARSGSQTWEKLSLSYLSDLADPLALDTFHQSETLRKSLATLTHALERLGLKNLLDFSKLPRSSLVSRFGPHAHLIWERLNSPQKAQALVWPRWKLPDRIIEKVELYEHEQCARLEPLLFKSKELLDRVMSRLQGRGLRLSCFSLELELEKHSAVKEPKRLWTFKLLLPQGTVKGVLNILRERLDRGLSQKPLGSLVQAMKIQVLETAPGRGSQTNFFHQREERDELVSSLIGRVAEKLGEAQIFHAQVTESYFPESSWKKTISPKSLTTLPEMPAALETSAKLPYGERPTRLFQPPKLLHRKGPILSLQQGTLRTQRWQVVHFTGPERISSEWWGTAERASERNYYRVEVDSGQELWIFKDELGGIYLHGIFE